MRLHFDQKSSGFSRYPLFLINHSYLENPVYVNDETFLASLNAGHNTNTHGNDSTGGQEEGSGMWRHRPGGLSRRR